MPPAAWALFFQVLLADFIVLYLLSLAGAQASPQVVALNLHDCELLQQWPSVAKAMGLVDCHTQRFACASSKDSVDNGKDSQWSCDDGGNIVNLALRGNSIIGTLPASWNGMASLESLDLSNNNISGALPDSWSSMKQLGYLDLSSNNISGALPDSWGSMKQLVYLVLSDNNISGALPDNWSIMPTLYSLDLSNNNISGALPDSWSRLTLGHLDLSNNNISGALPDSWSSMKPLGYLDLSNNNISGSLPDSWSSLNPLVYLDLSNNNISGSLPDSWSSMASLSSLDLSNNNISGALPDSWSSMIFLGHLDMSNNRISGALPSSWKSMLSMNVSNNQLHGQLPKDLSSMIDLLVLDIASNQFNGALPALPRNLQILRATDNSLQGVIPTVPPSIAYLHMGNNSLTGAIPAIPANSSMRFMNLDDNLLQQLPKVFEAPNITYLSIARNRLVGTLPQTLPNELLTYVDLGTNMLSGGIPSPWTMKQWRLLALDANKLNGTLPGSWSGAVEVLLLHNNSITGCLPTEWAANDTLRALSLSNNRLNCTHGKLPASWGTQGAFSNLSLIALDGNHNLARIPSNWLTGFQGINTTLLMGSIWKSSSQDRSWRQTMCIQQGFNKRLASQLVLRTSESIFRGVKQAIEAQLGIISSQVLTSIVAKLVADIEGLDIANYDSVKLPPPALPQLDQRLSSPKQPNKEQICSNASAVVVVAVLWSVFGILVLLLLCAYLVEVNWKLISTGCRSLQHHMPWLRCGSAGAHQGRYLKVSHAVMVMLMFSLVFYWIDIAADIILLQKVWPVRSGIRWGLLGILLFHYILAACLVAWRLTVGQVVSQRCAWLVFSLCLAPVMPLVDTTTFCILAWNTGVPPHQRIPPVTWLQRLPFSLSAWQGMFHMRDVMEVLLEAVPTAVVQATAFVVGNTPQFGIYLETSIYLVSAVSSAIQILRLLATVLWRAWEQGISPGRALLDKLLWRDAGTALGAPLPPGSKDVEGLWASPSSRYAEGSILI